MFTSDQIHPVSDFSRKPAEHIKRLKETGQSEVLTVSGKAELVIQDAKSYEEMASLLHALRQVAIAKQQHEKGEAVSVDDAFAALSKRLESRYPNAGF